MKLKDLLRNIQEELEKDFKHFIPTTIAYKETSASTKTRICWDSSRMSRESASLNSILLKGSAEYSVVKMLVQFREGKHRVSADIKIFYNNLHLDPSHYKYQMAMWRPNMLPDEEAEELVLRVHFYGIRSSGGLCMAAVKKMVAFAKERGLNAIAKVLESAYVDDCNSSVTTLEELKEIKEEMPDFMKEHGFPIKALAWTGESAPEELTDNGLINTAGYS